ncbi:hypothetical protein CUMW_270920 [Citrus unshiu]|uniref:Uncharacterized protein n=1 Tax=Citrus unshiu TaxID=55188 RepID=A0A2H5QXH0_CITUN|nr:hypothetical protein CUMW_270920 [Citrus unshiu]
MLSLPCIIGYNDWSEGSREMPLWSLIADDEINGNMDLLVVSQYGRNPDHTAPHSGELLLAKNSNNVAENQSHDKTNNKQYGNFLGGNQAMINTS